MTQDALQERLGYRFADPSVLREALTHTTYANEHPEEGTHSERLEFLGDAVVGAIVADLLLGHLPEEPEGELTRRRARVVRREGLADIARRLDLGSALRLGEGQRRADGAENENILADALEAVVAAVFRDGGFAEAHRVFAPIFSAAIARSELPIDNKTLLQEKCHAAGESAPRYEILATEGPDHARFYTVRVSVGDVLAAAGSGSSKKAAEQDAAKTALKAWPVEAPEN